MQSARTPRPGAMVQGFVCGRILSFLTVARFYPQVGGRLLRALFKRISLEIFEQNQKNITLLLIQRLVLFYQYLVKNE